MNTVAKHKKNLFPEHYSKKFPKVKCKNCGKKIPRGYYYGICLSCQKEEEKQRTHCVDWANHKTYSLNPVYSQVHDKYFYTEDDISLFCDIQGLTVDDLVLVVCDRIELKKIRQEALCDVFSSSNRYELSENVSVALDNLNDVIEQQSSYGWMPTKIPAIVKNKTFGGCYENKD